MGSNYLNSINSPRLIAVILFIATIGYCWIAERTWLFQPVDKTHDPRFFLLCCGLCVFFTLRSWTVIPTSTSQQSIVGGQDVSPLPREQTEEWKGWMQTVILLYHLFGLSNNLPIYQVMRVLVAAYIFLTGYSHTSYFLKTNNFSLERTIKTLLRLNLLSCTLAYVLNRSCDFYYFPVLTSFWYLVIFVTIRGGRTTSGKLSRQRVGFSLFISFLLVQLSLYTVTGNAIWNSSLSILSTLGGPHINAREFIFRLKLDSISPYWGALLAVVCTKFNSEAAACSQYTFQASSTSWRFTGAVAPVIVNSITAGYFLAVQQFEDKITSNIWHPLLSIIPISTMLVARNATIQRRQGYNRCFRWLGSISLETYVLQSHIWLTKNNKKLLHISIFDRLTTTTASPISSLINILEVLILTTTFLLISHLAAQATKSLIDWLANVSNRFIVILFVSWMLNLHWRAIGF